MAKSKNVQQVLSNKGDAIEEIELELAPSTPAEELPMARPTREDRIRLAAYAASERRGFAPGSEAQDWLDAERQVDAKDDTAAQ